MQAVYAHTKRTDRKGTFGGKADSLFLLLDAGFNVPAFAVIPLEEGLSIIPEKFVLASDFEAAQKTIREYTFDGVFLQELISSFRTRFYAVRSSAPDEDGGEFSFAGQFETELFVTPEKLAEAIKKVWLSAYSDRARQYRLANNISSRHGIAVVIQEMVEAQSSGVAFGINPATGKRNEKVISAVFGLGEGLVSGQMNADNYFVGGKKVITEIAEKKEQLVFNKAAGNGTTYVPIDAADQNKPVLSDRQALEIAAVLEQLKELRRRPQDIEFAYRESLFYLLQSRPVTTVSKIPDQEGKYIVWDNSNIIESYPGITSPLTFSFIRKMYEAVYIRFSGLMGISEKEISANANTYENMLGLLNGRVYYNLRSWYKILSLLPGYSLNTGFMEKMMGVKEKFVLNDYSPRTKFRERLRVLK
ncbi:MAG TPA: PEP/pyruvate-binding domain-containing protein, partial [Bacteroidia bacterium]|nr:PEP/pyruvate-binding domain-containing protein [Bacteroidia bacterium]